MKSKSNKGETTELFLSDSPIHMVKTDNWVSIPWGSPLLFLNPNPNLENNVENEFLGEVGGVGHGVHINSYISNLLNKGLQPLLICCKRVLFNLFVSTFCKRVCKLMKKRITRPPYPWSNNKQKGPRLAHLFFCRW